MSEIEVRPLRGDLPFGARIGGVTEEALENEAVRRQISDVFEDRGLILFEKVEASSPMQLAISEVFGPLKEHPIKLVTKVDEHLMPGVIEINYDMEKSTLVEIDGNQRVNWLFWHFDHCYNNELNRAGVLRAVQIPPEDGMTVFGDGIQLHKSFSPDLLEQIEGCEIIYRFEPDSVINFARPKDLRIVRAETAPVLEFAKTMPRAIHPAVWTRRSGERVLHVSPWMAVGIFGQDDASGDALLEAVCQEIVTKIQPYFHSWKPDEMIIWDNWRMLHASTGINPKYSRLMHRTTIKGDYGLGRWEFDPQRPVVEPAM